MNGFRTKNNWTGRFICLFIYLFVCLFFFLFVFCLFFFEKIKQILLVTKNKREKETDQRGAVIQGGAWELEKVG